MRLAGGRGSRRGLLLLGLLCGAGCAQREVRGPVGSPAPGGCAVCEDCSAAPAPEPVAQEAACDAGDAGACAGPERAPRSRASCGTLALYLRMFAESGPATDERVQRALRRSCEGRNVESCRELDNIGQPAVADGVVAARMLGCVCSHNHGEPCQGLTEALGVLLRACWDGPAGCLAREQLFREGSVEALVCGVTDLDRDLGHAPESRVRALPLKPLRSGVLRTQPTPATTQAPQSRRSGHNPITMHVPASAQPLSHQLCSRQPP
jgi:hypothetical protein